MATKKYPHLTVPIKDLVPPFVNGDWVTAVSEDSMQFLPSTSNHVRLRVIQIAQAAEYVGASTSSGWQLFGVDSKHFRMASLADVAAERQRLREEMAHFHMELEMLKELHDRMKTTRRT